MVKCRDALLGYRSRVTIRFKGPSRPSQFIEDRHNSTIRGGGGGGGGGGERRNSISNR